MKTLEHYSNHCRTCLIELDEKKVHIYDNDNIPNMLLQCTTLSIFATDGLMQYMCEPCRQHLLIAYNFKEKSIEVDTFLRGFLTKDLEEVGATPTDEPLNCCHLCHKTFTRKTTLQIHLERHKNTRNHKCDLCPKSFATKEDLRVHRSRHTNTDIFKCHTCSRCFKSKNAIAKHVKVHSGPKSHLCPYCGKSFSAAETLRTHLKLHTGENFLSCQYCDRKFAARASLHFHLRKHTEETPHLCSHCGAKFKTSSELKGHEVRHASAKNLRLQKVEVCDVCGKGYRSRNGLAKHKLGHSQQWYQCNECSYKCHTNRDLEIHRVVHTGRYPFVCLECGKGFNRKNNYLRHCKKHQ